MMKKFLLSLTLILSLFCVDLHAQYKPLSAMTKVEVDALTDAKLKEMVINDWGGQLVFMIRGVAYPSRVVNAFAENFKDGATKWLSKNKWVTVDYIIAEELRSFYQNWYLANGNCYDAVLAMHKMIPTISIERVMDDIMSSAVTIYEKQQAGLITVTPPELVGAAAMINSLSSRREETGENQGQEVRLRAMPPQEMSVRAAASNPSSQIQVRNIQLLAMESDDRSAPKASRATYLRIDCELKANQSVQSGNRKIYVRITGPNGLLTNNPDTFVAIDSKSLTYTTSREIYYANEELAISLYYNKGGIAGGAYNIEIYIDGYLCGSAETILR